LDCKDKRVLQEDITLEIQDVRTYFSPDLVDALYLHPGDIDKEFHGTHVNVAGDGVFGLPPIDYEEIPNDMKIRIRTKNLSMRFPTTYLELILNLS